MSFYDPMQAGPDWGGGIQDLMQQFMLYQMISQMYPGKTTEELSTSPLPEKRDVKDLFHSLGINPGDEGPRVGESELPPQRRVGHYRPNKAGTGLDRGYHGFGRYNPWLVSDLWQAYPPSPYFSGRSKKGRR